MRDLVLGLACDAASHCAAVNDLALGPVAGADLYLGREMARAPVPSRGGACGPMTSHHLRELRFRECTIEVVADAQRPLKPVGPRQDAGPRNAGRGVHV